MAFDLAEIDICLGRWPPLYNCTPRFFDFDL